MRPEIIAAVLAGEATPEEMRLFEDWLEEDPSHRAEFETLQRAWHSLPAALGGVDVSIPTAAELIARAEARAADARVAPLHPRRIGWRQLGWRTGTIAAAAILGVTVGVLNRPADQDAGFAARQVITDDHQATVSLGDGTVVRLAPRSRLSVDSRDEREVRLEGRAYFVVVSSAGRRFRVHTQHGTVTVFGTRFDTDAADSLLRVVVVQGHVAVESSSGRVDLRTSEMGRVGSEGVPRRSRVDDVYAVTDWLDSFLAFEATPLSAVAAELRRRYDIRLEVDESIANRTLTGWFTEQTADEIVDAICTAADATCERRGGITYARIRAPQ